MPSNEDMVEMLTVEFGEAIFVWKTPCPECGLKDPTVSINTVPRCWRCNALLGTDEVFRWEPPKAG